MTATSVLYMLLGAALVAAGVLVSALADRVRGLRASREKPGASREKTAQSLRSAIPVVEPAELLTGNPYRAAPPVTTKPVRAVRPEPKVQVNAEGGDDVIAALVASGYKKPIATEATWACTADERVTVERWTVSALCRCVCGGMS